MDGNFNDYVVCCFCGEPLFFKDAVILTIQPSSKSDEKQQLFCHKKHFVERIDKSIFLHPDFMDDNNE